jgi:endonuclease/exonuclease/phosphatase family metal-dependent hydrolase
VPSCSDRYGSSVLATRWEHRAVEALDLGLAGSGDRPWATLAAVVSLPGLGEMLSSRRQRRGARPQRRPRERQVIAIADRSRHRRDLPTVIVGDFNCRPGRLLTGTEKSEASKSTIKDQYR